MARECFINECKPEATGINQCVSLNGYFIVYNSTSSNKMIPMQFFLHRRYREATDREHRQSRNIRRSRSEAINQVRDYCKPDSE
jgi:hypothetical protein